MRSASKKPRLRSKGSGGMSEPNYPSEKSVEVVVTLRAYRDRAARQAGVFSQRPGW